MRLALLTFVAILGAVTSALALQVKLPKTLTAKATVVADELGNVLFGTIPGKVEVTNFPSGQGSSSGPGTPFSVYIDTLSSGTQSVPVTTVPSGQQLLITDIDGFYQCTQTGGNSTRCVLQDGTGTRFAWWGAVSYQHSFTTGIVFQPGEVVTWTTSLPPGGGAVQGPITFMGRLIPAS
jgi:hypothetical protein